MKKNFHVVVIGGGIVGLSTAYYLVKAGKRVLLIEKNEIGNGASGSCDEMILLQSKEPGILLEMTLESLEMYKGLRKELKVDIEFQNNGGMVFIENEQELKIIEAFVKKQKQYGVNVEILDRKDVLKKQPYINKKIIASTFCKMDSQVNPLHVMRGLMIRSIALGLEFKKGIITKMDQKKDHWRVYFYNGEYVDTQYIVNTAGAWASEVGNLIGINIPIIPKRGQIIVTEKIPKIGETNGWSARYIVRKIKPELFQEEEDSKLGVGFSISQTASGNYLIGSTREFEGYNKKTTYEALKIIINQGIYYFPILKKVHIIRSFAGLRPATPDGKPILDEVADKKGYFVAAGHEGDGIALAPITGKLMAKFINGEKIYYDINVLRLNRFKKEKV
ncbi:FAD-binding oxidoreductase [Crassaminicella thermophila]|uniref:FAD-binding oxidoreductase n=1 Tax=Crassaminicella thermophila TaxID=2599308 RepID=A0A5C0SGB8_CRATE|nr:FAD-dependent oxidoreductase [Crassaminicella thermophila]QEK12444.1 FAD-binding oxidoreductase [Crassaminicella thermophila]